ncbi:hypothetical protein [Corynebacterium sp. HMSC074A01]|uniref:hypothetical protein n=1 Tax=Corynebacterium sp. HMSC074A01 TaxID=1715030 RepID=UPI0008A31758|nr:hypothetical protein [Corynebacterium sp. HMSC074A01]OHF36471.1 hypothetical protein HMPREF2550_07855 [Corynebacterium sp. HMSC074A01]
MSHRRILAPALLAASVALTACGGGGEDTPEATEATEATESTENAENTESTVQSESASPTTSTEETATASSSQEASTESSTRASTSKRGGDAEDETVAKVAETFASLAPESLFTQLETCAATGVSGSYDCSGAEIGQFQFFDSEAKAASTTQLLTELRSSRIVEDDGERIVGWSTLGTSAIITVVDNERGQVLQQLVSTEQEDPRERIGKLGLAEVSEEDATEKTRETTTTKASETTSRR